MKDRIRALEGAHLTKKVFLSTVSGVASTKKEMIDFLLRQMHGH